MSCRRLTHQRRRSTAGQARPRPAFAQPSWLARHNRFPACETGGARDRGRGAAGRGSGGGFAGTQPARACDDGCWPRGAALPRAAARSRRLQAGLLGGHRWAEPAPQRRRRWRGSGLAHNRRPSNSQGPRRPTVFVFGDPTATDPLTKPMLAVTVTPGDHVEMDSESSDDELDLCVATRRNTSCVGTGTSSSSSSGSASGPGGNAAGPPMPVIPSTTALGSRSPSTGHTAGDPGSIEPAPPASMSPAGPSSTAASPSGTSSSVPAPGVPMPPTAGTYPNGAI